MSKRSIALYATLSFMVLAKVLSILALLGSARAPDPKTGRTEALVFARVISDSPSYITLPEAVALSAAYALVVLCALALGWFSLRERLCLDDVGAQDTTAATRLAAISRGERAGGFGRRNF